MIGRMGRRAGLALVVGALGVVTNVNGAWGSHCLLNRSFEGSGSAYSHSSDSALGAAAWIAANTE